jgi:AraC family transcriptional regulator, glycine betaine-responsive activator
MSGAFAPSAQDGNDLETPFAATGFDGTVGLDILLLPEFDLFDLGIAQEVAAIFNQHSVSSRFAIRVRAVGAAQVRSSCAIEVPVEPREGWAPNLLVLGGAAAARRHGAPWLFGLRRAAYESARVFSDAGGTLALASAGMLDRQVAAAPWQALAAWEYLAPKVRFLPAVRVAGRKFHSCTGGRALLDLLLACLSRQFGREVAATVANGLNVSVPLPPATETASRSCLPSRCGASLDEAVRAMRSNLAEPLNIEQLCFLGGGVSERTLQRLFRRHLGSSVFGYYRRCRLLHAREMLRLTPLTVTDVALAAGFQCATHFSQAYVREFGCTPTRERRGAS